MRAYPNDEDRNRALKRVLRLAKRLEGVRVRPPVARLADEFRVCHRTIRRDLAALQDAGWLVPKPVEQVKLTGTPSLRHAGEAHPWRVS